jgi:hypothetical protein
VESSAGPLSTDNQVEAGRRLNEPATGGARGEGFFLLRVGVWGRVLLESQKRPFPRIIRMKG